MTQPHRYVLYKVHYNKITAKVYKSIPLPRTRRIYIRGVHLSTGIHNELPLCRCGAVTPERVGFSRKVQVDNGTQQSKLSRNALLLSKMKVYDLSHKRPQHKPSHFIQSVSTPLFLVAYFNIILISSLQCSFETFTIQSLSYNINNVYS